MSEKDVVGVIIPPQYSTPTTSSAAEPKFIKASVEVLSSPSNTIIFSKTENMGQFVVTAHSIVSAKEETGANIPLSSLVKATTFTGDIAVAVDNIPLPESLRGRKSGIISNEKGAIVWDGNISVVITSVYSPVNPVTGEGIFPPGQINATYTLPNPQLTQIHLAGNTSVDANVITSSPYSNSQQDSNLGFVRQLTDAELKEAVK